MVEAETEDERPEEVPDAVWDAELRAWRVPADRHAWLISWLAASRVRISDEMRVRGARFEWKLPVLRWYQEAALARWEGAGARGVVSLPTGAGKTLVALSAIARMGVTTLCLVPTRLLLDQWARALAACASQPIGRLGDGDHVVAPITVATYASAVSWMPRIGDRFGLVVVDEAHHVGAWCPGEIFEMMVARARLGLTATPPEQADALERHVGPVVYSLTVDDLAGDALASYEVTTVPVALEHEERSRYRVLRGRFAAGYSAFQRAMPDGAWHEFVRASSQTIEGRGALAAWREYRALLAYPRGKRAKVRELLALHPGSRALVFTADNATAYAIARELLVMPITYEIGRAERIRVIEAFRSGACPVLVSSQVLEEGFDVPEADIAIVVGGSSSVRRYVQRIGRVLRPREGKRARIYELTVEDTTEVSYVERRRAGLGERAAEVAAQAALLRGASGVARPRRDDRIRPTSRVSRAGEGGPAVRGTRRPGSLWLRVAERVADRRAGGSGGAP